MPRHLLLGRSSSVRDFLIGGINEPLPSLGSGPGNYGVLAPNFSATVEIRSPQIQITSQSGDGITRTAASLNLSGEIIACTNDIDTLYLPAGVYAGLVLNPFGISGRIKYLTIKPLPGVSQSQVIIPGFTFGQSTGTGSVRVRWVRFFDVTFTYPVSVHRSEDIQFQFCRLTNLNPFGVGGVSVVDGSSISIGGGTKRLTVEDSDIGGGYEPRTITGYVGKNEPRGGIITWDPIAGEIVMININKPTTSNQPLAVVTGESSHGKKINISHQTDAAGNPLSTADQIKAAVDAHATASEWVAPTVEGGTGSLPMSLDNHIRTTNYTNNAVICSTGNGEGNQDIVFRRCKVRQCQVWFNVRMYNNFTIEDCEMWDVSTIGGLGTGASDQHTDGIRTYGGGSNWTVKRNILWNCGGLLFFTKDGIDINLLVENNLFGPCPINWRSDIVTVSGLTVVNNTWLSNVTFRRQSAAVDQPVEHVIWFNNYCAGNVSNIDLGSLLQFDFKDNNRHSSTSNVTPGTNGTTAAAEFNSIGDPWDFPDGNNYIPSAADVIARNAGISAGGAYSAPSNDIINNPRPVGAFDIGAYERQ